MPEKGKAMKQTRQNLLILGAGQYGMVAKEIAESCGQYNIIAFLDDKNPIAIGKLNEYEKLKEQFSHAVVAMGDAVCRLELLDKLEQCGYEIPVLIHPTSYVSPSAKIECGSFIEPMAVIHTDVVIGKGCIISAGTIINHNSKIGSGCHLNCGTIVASNFVIQAQTKTQCGTKIL